MSFNSQQGIPYEEAVKMTNLQMHLTKILKNEQAKSLYLEVAKGAIFKEQNMTFGLFLGQLKMLKKNLGRLWTTFEGIFFFKLSLAFVLKGCIRSILYIYFRIFLAQNSVLCLFHLLVQYYFVHVQNFLTLVNIF